MWRTNFFHFDRYANFYECASVTESRARFTLDVYAAYARQNSSLLAVNGLPRSTDEDNYICYFFYKYIILNHFELYYYYYIIN